jgi:hypothetical protein
LSTEKTCDDVLECLYSLFFIHITRQKT